MTESFSGLAGPGRNFTKLEVKIVKASLQDKFVLEFRKVAPFLHKGGMGHCRKNRYRKMCCFARQNLIGDHTLTH